MISMKNGFIRWISFQAQKHSARQEIPDTGALLQTDFFFFTEFLNFSFVPPILLKFCPHLPKPHYYPHHNNKQYCLPNTLAFPPLFYQPLWDWVWPCDLL